MAPKIPSSIACTSISQLNDQFGLVKDSIELLETEENWDKILLAILRLTALVNGSGADYPSQLVAACKDVARPVNNSIKSERSRLSGAATDLLTALTTNLGRAFEPLIIHFVPGLLTLASRPNKVFVSRAKSCLKAVAEYCQSPVILPLLRNAVGDKAVTVRLTATDTVLICLNCFNPPDLEKSARAEDVEAVIKSTARDANADVRKSSKQVFEAYSLLLPHRVNAFVAPLTPVMRKYLAIKSSSQPVPSRSAMASSATTKPLPAPSKEAPSRARTISQTSRAPVPGPSRAPAQTTATKKPPSKPPSTSNAKVAEMPPPPPPRQPSSGPVRPTPDMLQRVPAASRPFTGKPFRPNKVQNVTHSSSMTGGFDAAKSQGVQRPEHPQPAEDKHSPIEIFTSELHNKASTTVTSQQMHAARVPQINPSVPPQNPSVNVKEQKRNPLEMPPPTSPSSSSDHKGPSRPASRIGREPVFRREEPPLTRSQSKARLSESSSKGSKEASAEATTKDTRTEDLTLEELTTVRPLPNHGVEGQKKPEGANTKSHKAQRPRKPEQVAPSHPPSNPKKTEEVTSRPDSSDERGRQRVGLSQPAPSESLQPDSHMCIPDSQPSIAPDCPSRADTVSSSGLELSRPLQERVRREKRPRPPPTASDVEQSQPMTMAPAQKKRHPSGESKNVGPSTSGAPSARAPRKVGKDGKPIVRTKEEEEARAARKAAKRRKLEQAQELLEREKAKELELRKARKAEKARAKANELLAKADVVETVADATGSPVQHDADARTLPATAMEIEVEEAQGVETLKPEEPCFPRVGEDDTSTPLNVPVEVASDAVMETGEPTLAIEGVDEEPVEEQTVDNCPVQVDSPLTEEPQDEPMPEAPAADGSVVDVQLPVADAGNQISITAIQVPSSPESSHTPPDSPPVPPQPHAPMLKTIKPLTISKPLPLFSEDNGGIACPCTPERQTKASMNLDLPFNSQQFVTPAPLRQHMNAKKRQKRVPATPISKLLDTIQKGFEFNAGDFSIMEETEEEVANASSFPESIAEADEPEEVVKEHEEMDITVIDGMHLRTDGDNNTTANESDEGLQTPRFVDTRPRKGKRSLCAERKPLALKNA